MFIANKKWSDRLTGPTIALMRRYSAAGEQQTGERDA